MSRSRSICDAIAPSDSPMLVSVAIGTPAPVVRLLTSAIECPRVWNLLSNSSRTNSTSRRKTSCEPSPATASR